MAKTKISEFSATPANNTDIDSINIAEGCAPSGINDAIRELMAQLKDFQTGAAGDSFNGPVGTTTAAAGSFTTLAYTGALTGGTGVVNLGSGQFYKDSSGNVGIGTSSPAYKLDVTGQGRATTGFAVSSDGSTFTPSGLNAVPNYGIGYITSTSQTAISGFGGIPFYTNQLERARIDSSGNVGIGTSSPAAKLDVSGGAIRTTIASKTAAFDAAGGSIYTSVNDGTKDWRIGVGIMSAGLFSIRNSTDSLTAVNIDSSGNLLVGKTSTANNATGFYVAGSGNADYGMVNVARPPNTTMIQIVNSSGNTVVGQISQNGSNTTYATSSDYRLKENIAPMTGALSRVAALKPCTYVWKATGETDEGFIAHELQEVCPSAVTGEKDAVNEDGTIKPQGIDTSFLTATITAALQELHQIVKDQAAEIAELKAKLP